jgi:hypothetical protein
MEEERDTMGRKRKTDCRRKRGTQWEERKRLTAGGREVHNGKKEKD